MHDFVLLNAQEGPVAKVLISRPSPTGRYYAAVYANFDGEYDVAVSRAVLFAEKGTITDSSLFGEVGSWLRTTTLGKITLALFILLLIVVFGACMGLACRQNSKVRLKLTKSMARLRNSRFGSRMSNIRRNMSGRWGPSPRTPQQAGEIEHRPAASLSRCATHALCLLPVQVLRTLAPRFQAVLREGLRRARSHLLLPLRLAPSSRLRE